MTIEELRAKLGDLKDQMQAILDKADEEERDLSEDESKQFDELEADVARTNKNIERSEKVAALERPQKLKSQQGTRVSSVARPRYGPLKAFRGEGAEERAYRCGQWMNAVLFGNHAAFQWCEQQGINMLAEMKGGVIIPIRAASSEGSMTAGGALVPDEFLADLIDLQERFGVARRFANVVPMTTDHVVVPRRTGGLTAYAIGENTEPTESNMTFDQVGLTAKKWMVLSKYSSELSDDAAISIADMLLRETAIAFATSEDDALFNGDGTATYHGILGVVDKFADGSSYDGAVDPDTSAADTFAEIAAVDIAKLISKLPLYALDRANFYCSQPAFSLVFERLAQASGGNTKRDAAAATPYQYQGYGVAISQKMPLTGANNQVMLLFGDLSMSTSMGVRRQVTMRVLTERYAELDQLAVVASERFDINTHDIGDSSTAGPLVALIGAS